MEPKTLKEAYGKSLLLSSPGMHEMADNIASLLAKKGRVFDRARLTYEHFANGEAKPTIPQTVRGEHVFFLHPMQHPEPNLALILMLLTNDALARASAAGITLVLPYLSYTRQDRKDKGRVPISARVVADLIQTNPKVERLITFDLHADQIQGFYSIPVDNLLGMQVHARYFRERFGGDYSKTSVVAPDYGSSVRARRFADLLDPTVPVTIIEKRRIAAGETKIMGINGPEVASRDVIIYDDMIDSGGTNHGAVAEMQKQGAATIYNAATHGLFTKGAEARFAEAGLPVVVCNTIPRTPEYRVAHASWLSFASIDELLADAISEASTVGGSVSKLFIT
ncbi:hypothetical protein A2765_01350 [Candidatus Kaiserbacteria bacterium RIFCSPHIGHO2_01_FULL_56_24]|uniref:ribose-phosphate diphosphokinase n=1 Tax=Candidatus Kaiserbacteria bacterium RIFCSPHIGHO2_01_FULL_56_24 TaxID=1798487 RepID=A0A1F6DIL0_9BACT|nr:MAG: hypothetical protein A2765_01350 [Candidatus Kaiserbacteria bacterium RIFCSPHIGHO2_01_FULL_56_24]